MEVETREGRLLWEPSDQLKEQSVLRRYMRWLAARRSLRFESYQELWRWSVSDVEAFWTSIVEFFEIPFSRGYERVLSSHTMPGAHWFEGAELNFAECVLSHATSERPALVHASEATPFTALSWDELSKQVASVASGLRRMGIGRGDRVAAYLPNVPEAMAACLAVASLGAVWSSCSPDFGLSSVVDRFAQIEPKALFAVAGYRYGGKTFDRRGLLKDLLVDLPTVKQVVLVPAPGFDQDLEVDLGPGGAMRWEELSSDRDAPIVFEQVPFEHPLWVLYSSGTTGLPKGIVHGHGGVVLEHLKGLALQCDAKPGERFYLHTSTGWMLWNWAVGGLLTGATEVLYDGNPGHPTLDRLWELIEQAGVTIFGTGAALLIGSMKAGLKPGLSHDLSRLREIVSTGSPLPPEAFGWAYSSIKPDLWLASTSGGTDVVSAFMGGSPLLPVRAGELQCRWLGTAAAAFDTSGKAVTDEVGELVITEPMPSMPLQFWNDPEQKRYRESYFETFPGVWRHGDWIRFTPEGGSVIQGRSDATLNRQGVRLGTSEIYAAVEALPEVADSLIIGIDLPNGDYYMPLFVQLSAGASLDEALERRIKEAIRTSVSPRYVPEQILSVPAIPRTLTGKKLETPVKKLFLGVPLEKAVSVEATSDPRGIEFFANLAQQTSPLLKG